MKLLILLLFCTPLFAGPMSLSWVNPTERTDDTPYPASERGGIIVQYWIPGGPNTRYDVTNGDATSVVIDVPSGAYKVQIFAYDIFGNESAFTSPPLDKVVGGGPALANPKPPTNLK